ncbi:hypothetical protein CP532_5788 [Ophiocordyceps camponoti-leonardi (nom. inval.)]|nr:hypothetical protein CP532_5788 [Ophiocordyceps camponoti-leonardi (nom. inval.)]
MPSPPDENLFFNYVVDSPQGLTVRLFRCVSSHTFPHNPSPGANPISSRRAQEVKVTGFLALPDGPVGEKIIAWSKSGYGETSSPSVPPTLANDIWTRRVVKVADLLGMKTGTPFDLAGESRENMTMEEARARKGRVRASHVEVKLAVHAIYVLLQIFLPKRKRRTMSIKTLKKLRGLRWDDGSSLAFRIVISRENCTWCGAFVRTLSRVTGVEMKIVPCKRIPAFEPVLYNMSNRPVGNHARAGEAPSFK